jgi:thymidylate synthase (FAD)
MRIIKPAFIIEDEALGLLNSDTTLKLIEKLTRRCYKSEDKITPDSAGPFLDKVLHTFKHEGIADHRVITVSFFTDRGVSHELVRHRVAAYLQESTRYVDYSKKGMTFVQPPWARPGQDGWEEFVGELKQCEERYMRWREFGWKPQEARGFLPHFVKTEIGATLNFTSWRNFFKKRCHPAAHPQIRQLAVPLLREFKRLIPVFFDDLEVPELPFEEAVKISCEEELVEVYSL